MNNVLLGIYIFTVFSMSGEIGWILTKGNRDRQTFMFIICQILINIWSVSQVLLLASVTDEQMFLSYCVGNTGICWIGTAWLAFSYFYAQKSPPSWLSVVSVSFSLFMWIICLTNNLHGFYYEEFSLHHVEYNPLFYVNISYVYVCILVGILNLYKQISADSSKKNQFVLLLLAALIPLITNMLNLFNVIKTTYDITPLAFSISSVLFLLATNRYGFLNVNSIAFEKALQAIEEGVIVFNQNDRSTYYNDGITHYFEISSATTRAEFYELIKAHSHTGIEQCTDTFFETELDIDSHIIELKQYTSFDRKGKLLAVTIIVTDMTRYYEMREQEQALFEARESLTIECERNRIAQEVHDTTGHTLTMINALSKLTSISISKGEFDEAAQYSQESQVLASQGISQLRMSINNLRNNKPTMITQGIEQLAQSARGVKVEVCIQGEETPRYAFCSNVIYENVREAITNCVRYSNATQIDIIIKFQQSCVDVFIIDNGDGCDDIKLGNGLKGMRERCEKAGGEIAFTSSTGCGFTITMNFPILKG